MNYSSLCKPASSEMIPEFVFRLLKFHIHFISCAWFWYFLLLNGVALQLFQR